VYASLRGDDLYSLARNEWNVASQERVAGKRPAVHEYLLNCQLTDLKRRTNGQVKATLMVQATKTVQYHGHIYRQV
jgi:hypothetical protein